jgi:hypothetical protein
MLRGLGGRSCRKRSDVQEVAWVCVCVDENDTMGLKGFGYVIQPPFAMI